MALELLRTRSRATHVISTASSVLDTNYYAILHQAGIGVIDGGFGEVGRRQFMNRLLRLGPGWKDPQQVLAHISISRTPIFTKETVDAMICGTLREIECQRDALPARLHPENEVDLISVRTRLPNFFGLEQNRLDSMAACFMPFAQPSVLRALFQVPLPLRRNGRLFRQLIKQRHSHLTRYPLVKGGTTLSFWLPTTGALVVSRIKKSVGLAYQDPRPHQYLELVKPVVLELVHSDAVRTYGAYDVSALQRIVLEYYGGNSALSDAVDWWLAFEMWRRFVQCIA